MVKKIVSGGQTGVDRAALDVALDLGIHIGGWCPKGRLAEDGVIPEGYPMMETPLPIYRQRTEWNVRDADATLILAMGQPEGGTALTAGMARKLGRPHLVVDLAEDPQPAAVRAWIECREVETLNVAGPRESSEPGVYDLAREFLREILGSYAP